MWGCVDEKESYKYYIQFYNVYHYDTRSYAT